jgi:hypothetical protein
MCRLDFDFSVDFDFVLIFGGSLELGGVFVGVLMSEVYKISFGCSAYILRPLFIVYILSVSICLV